MVLAGIVTYNPEIERLTENLTSVSIQVDQVIVVDNGSNNFQEVENLIGTFSNVDILNLNHNFGIATALNRIMEFAERKGMGASSSS